MYGYILSYGAYLEVLEPAEVREIVEERRQENRGNIRLTVSIHDTQLSYTPCHTRPTFRSRR
jgi:hypothetical protein